MEDANVGGFQGLPKSDKSLILICRGDQEELVRMARENALE